VIPTFQKIGLLTIEISTLKSRNGSTGTTTLRVQAESEYRHSMLIKRAQHKFGTSESSGDPPASLTTVDRDAMEAAQGLASGQRQSSISLHTMPNRCEAAFHHIRQEDNVQVMKALMSWCPQPLRVLQTGGMAVPLTFWDFCRPRILGASTLR
jgi:hypothetical protein